MNQIQALNLYLSNYNHIYTDIINAIMNIESKSKKIYDKTKTREMKKLKLYLSYLD